MFLYHYFDKKIGPFLNISELPINEAESVLKKIRIEKPSSQPASRHPNYIKDRLHYEEILRVEFEKKGGIITRNAPNYMVVEHSPWLSDWYENCDFLKIPIKEFDLRTLSFTYGDSHPTFSPRVNDGKEYRKQLYTYDEILKVIEKYGYPQDWNDDGKFGPERYIEVQVWSDETINKFKNI